MLRRALAFWIPAAVLATLACGLIYVVGQQGLRTAANDPQIQLAEDAATALDAGASPASVVGAATVDTSTSLAPFVVVYDPAGTVLASDGRLDGAAPVPPIGVLRHARSDPPNLVTWQPRSGLRFATATVPWSGGTVMAARSLREVERREDQALALAGLGWLAMLVGLAAASLLAAAVWPRPATPVDRSDHATRADPPT